MFITSSSPQDLSTPQNHINLSPKHTTNTNNNDNNNIILLFDDCLNHNEQLTNERISVMQTINKLHLIKIELENEKILVLQQFDCDFQENSTNKIEIEMRVKHTINRFKIKIMLLIDIFYI